MPGFDNRPRYPCFECNFHGKDNADRSTVERVGEKGTYQCSECRCKLEENTPRVGCETQFGRIRVNGGEWEPIYCSRRLCMDCMSRSRYLREHSRWNHKEPEWKSSLFGCDGLPGLTFCALLNYYNCGSPAGPQLNDDEAVDRSFGRFCCANLVGTLMGPLALLWDIVGCKVCTLNDQQASLKEKFGIEPMSGTTVFFCRWCAEARLKREVHLRGYWQRYPCGPSQVERKSHRPPLPPGVPSSMSVYSQPPPMMGFEQPTLKGSPAMGQLNQPMFY